VNTELLKRLCETPGVPGRETRVRDLIMEEAEELFDDFFMDPLGTLVARRHPRVAGRGKTKTVTPKEDDDATRVLLLSHMDEIGFLVRHISDKGYVHIEPVGGFDPRNLFSRRVMVCGAEGDYLGVMNPGGKPIHISSQEERKKVPEVKEFYIDLGMSAAEVKKRVNIGDMVVMHEPFIEMGDKLVSKALDNRVACWLGLESVRALEKAKTPHPAEIIVAFTVQEEVGLRGAKTSSFTIEPDVAIGLDVTLSCDTPGVPTEEAVTIQGEGAGLHVKDSAYIADISLIEELEAVAKKKRIKTQRTVLSGGGQDGAAAQQVGQGCRAAGVMVGTRYIHTVTEMIDKRDLKAANDLLAAWMPTVK